MSLETAASEAIADPAGMAANAGWQPVRFSVDDFERRIEAGVADCFGDQTTRVEGLELGVGNLFG